MVGAVKLKELFDWMRRPVIGPYVPLRSPAFDTDPTLEQKAHAARIAMGDAYLCAVPVKRKLEEQPDTFVRIADVPEDAFPIG